MEKEKIKRISKEWFDAGIFALVLFLIIRAFVVQAFKIPTGSMRPTLKEGDMLLVSKFWYGAKIPFTGFSLPAVSEPKRGDVIVFLYPVDKKRDFIKRLIGLGGETIEIKDGKIYVNGRVVDDPRITSRFYYNRGPYGSEGEKIQVPEDSYFVLGDNSGSSHDSRFWGFVPKKYLIGNAFVIYWPPNRLRLIK
ncbi:MAG: signal peptidase I [Candidatus Omnitrophica bacterium CG11_big_fil_rev_8_21_14_0_20_42_13]|uniref:Signal peptidase I n=1 Tax=Candidatus Ghiorseimicrobium undicola TaxID=1974746 RepID=A0A2H0LZN8_9BACT|nr:MAG: signal peptidase I [Candidatus Omnitrophica bacterium CG11_big_fil_rev_8_21_14_0_20_42_13]